MAGGNRGGIVDGADRMPAERGGCLQNDQLGEYRVDCRYAPDVAGAGKDGGFFSDFLRVGKLFGELWSRDPVSGYLFYHVADDHVYQQHGDSGTSSPDSTASRGKHGGKPLPVPVCRDGCRKYVFASPFSTPPNALVMSAGKYTFMDYVKVGLPLQVIMGVVMVLVLPLLFPF